MRTADYRPLRETKPNSKNFSAPAAHLQVRIRSITGAMVLAMKYMPRSVE